MKESNILFEIGNYWVSKSDKHTGYDVWEAGITHSRRCAIIGYDGEKGLERAKAEAVKRNNTKN
jgi:hypothetical protein